MTLVDRLRREMGARKGANRSWAATCDMSSGRQALRTAAERFSFSTFRGETIGPRDG